MHLHSERSKTRISKILKRSCGREGAAKKEHGDQEREVDYVESRMGATMVHGDCIDPGCADGASW